MDPISNLCTIFLQDERRLNEQIELSAFEELEKNLQRCGQSGIEQQPTNNLSSASNTALLPGHQQNVSSSTHNFYIIIVEKIVFFLGGISEWHSSRISG